MKCAIRNCYSTLGGKNANPPRIAPETLTLDLGEVLEIPLCITHASMFRNYKAGVLKLAAAFADQFSSPVQAANPGTKPQLHIVR